MQKDILWSSSAIRFRSAFTQQNRAAGSVRDIIGLRDENMGYRQRYWEMIKQKCGGRSVGYVIFFQLLSGQITCRLNDSALSKSKT